MIVSVLLLLGIVSAPLPAQQAGAPGGAAATGVTAYREAALLPDPDGPLLALAIRLPEGSGADPIGLEGTAFLLGRVLEAEGHDRLRRHGAFLEVEVRPDETVLTLLSPPGPWREALADVEALAFGAGPTFAAVDAIREEVLDILGFETGSPIRAFERERASALLGAAHPAARPVTGTLGSISLVGAAELSAFRTQHFRKERGVVAVAGPLTAGALESTLATPVRTFGGGSAPQTGAREPLRVPTVGSGPLAWDTPARTVVDRNLTSTWIALAIPFAPGTPPLLLDFLGHLVLESLNLSPPDPGLYETGAMVVRVRDAPVLVVSASVDPRITARWEDRLMGSLPSLADAPPTGSFYELTRRRFRSSLVLALAQPEERVRWAVRRLALTGTIPRLETELWRLDREAVAEAAGAAGPPRILLFGPAGMMGR